jgi:hypothetical protein
MEFDMDPNANLREQRELCELQNKRDLDESEAERLVDLVVALDEWLCNGGMKPDVWTHRKA